MSKLNGENNAFEDILASCGLHFKRNGQPVLDEDQTIFQRNLSQRLKKPKTAKEIEDFLAGFSSLIENVKKLHLFLSPTAIELKDDSIHAGNQDSLVRLMLRNTELQPKLCIILLEKLAELASNDDSAFEEGDFKKVPQMILFQFRWLDVIVDSSKFCDKLLEIFDVTTVEMQREIISVIPEILEDKEHEAVALVWSGLLKQRVDLAVTILDAFPLLNVPSNIINEVKTTVLEMMDSVRLDDLPIIVRFLLQSIETVQDATEVLKELKLKLDFSSGQSGSSYSRNEEQTQQNYQVLTLAVIKAAFQCQPVFGSAMIKLLDGGVAEAENLHVIDVLLIFILLDVPDWKKQTLTLVNNCIRKGTLRKSPVKTVFTQYPKICLEYFTAIKGLMEILLRSNDTKQRKFAQFLYMMAFTNINDTRVTQDIVSALISHARSGRDLELGAALDVLEAFVVEQKRKISPFGIFLKGLLDYLETWRLLYIRKAYTILSHLGGERSADERELNGALYILVRKQIGNGESKYQRMGVVGALVCIKTLLKREDELAEKDVKLKDACELFKRVEHYMEKDVEAKALFYDEVATAIAQKKIHPLFETWLSECLSGDFEDDFIVEANDELQRIPAVEGEVLFSLNDIKETSICINLLPIGASDNSATNTLSTVKKRVFLACLAPQFRLLRLCVQSAHNNDLEEIDALLGCPVYFLSKNSLDDFYQSSNTAKKFICRCCFTLVNWFIELVNGFITQSDADIQLKIVARLKEIVEFRDKLAGFLAVTLDFTPPPAHFDMEPELAEKVAIPKVKIQVPKKKPAKRGIKRKSPSSPSQPGTSRAGVESQRNHEEEMEQDDEEEMDTSTAQAPEKTKKRADPVDLHLYSIFFRELDMDIFNVLRYELVLTGNNDLPAQENPKPVLSLKVLMFLLDDLQLKLEASLCSAEDTAKMGFFGREKLVNNGIIHHNLLLLDPSDVASSAIGLLPYLRKHLEAIAFQFRDLHADDSMVDEDVTPGADALSEAFRCILNVIETIFNWKGFKSPKNSTLITDALKVFCTSAPSGTPNDFTKSSFSYFNDMIEIAPDFACASTIIGVLDSIAAKNVNNFLNDRLAEATITILKKEWTNFKTGSSKAKVANDPGLLKLLSIYFKVVYKRLDALDTFVSKAIPELISDDNETGASEMFPTLTKVTFPIFYRVLFEQLIVNINKSRPQSSQNDEEWLTLWLISVNIFRIMVSLIKSFETPKVLAICLKQGRLFLDFFMKWAMPFLDKVLKKHKDDTIKLLKAMQLSTRGLQHLCTHSKAQKNVTLTNQVPPLKKVLEAFLFRVKAMLAMNKCDEGFWVGNLKNRTLQGHEILTQGSSDGESDEEGDGNKSGAEEAQEHDSSPGNASDSY